MQRLVSLILLVLLLSACAPAVETPSESDANAQGSLDSGIEGQVYLGECQGPQIATDCFEFTPYPAVLVVYSMNGREIERFETDDEGQFRVSLPPGTYVLHPESRALYPVAPDQIFVVAEGEFTHIVVVYDSGVR